MKILKRVAMLGIALGLIAAKPVKSSAAYDVCYFGCVFSCGVEDLCQGSCPLLSTCGTIYCTNSVVYWYACDDREQ